MKRIPTENKIDFLLINKKVKLTDNHEPELGKRQKKYVQAIGVTQPFSIDIYVFYISYL